jgi:hypothetical protein
MRGFIHAERCEINLENGLSFIGLLGISCEEDFIKKK